MLLRQVEVFATAKQNPEDFLGLALFHKFVQDHREYECGPGHIPSAIVEWVGNVNTMGSCPGHRGGQGVTVDPGQLRFLYAPTTDEEKAVAISEILRRP